MRHDEIFKFFSWQPERRHALYLQKVIPERDRAGHKKKEPHGADSNGTKIMDKDMERKFITQDDALVFLEDLMNRPSGSKLGDMTITIAGSSDDSLIALQIYEGSALLRTLCIIPDDMMLSPRKAMEYIFD